MRLPTPISASALLLLASHKVFATDVFISSGEVVACPGFALTNGTSFNSFLNPSNSNLALSLSGLHTVSGNATLEFAITADNGEAYNSRIDPCSVPSLPELCPASEGTLPLLSLNSNVPDETVRSMNLSAEADVEAQVWLYINGTGGSLYTTCVQTELRSNASDVSTQLGASGSSNGTAENGAGESSNGTSGDDAGSSDDTTQDSSAGTLQAVGYLSLSVLAIWLL